MPGRLAGRVQLSAATSRVAIVALRAEISRRGSRSTAATTAASPPERHVSISSVSCRSCASRRVPPSTAGFFQRATGRAPGPVCQDGLNVLEDRWDSTLQRAREGDPSALDLLFRTYHRQVYSFLRSQLAPADAEDAASDVFVGIARRVSSFEGDERSFRAWLFTIARNRVLDVRRRAARRPADSYPPDELARRAGVGNAEHDAFTQFGTESALSRIAGLPPSQAEVVLLRIVADLSVADVAKIVRKKPEAVRALQFRALNRLAREAAVREEVAS